MAGRESHDPNDLSLTQPVSQPPGHDTPERMKADSKTLHEASGGFLGAVGGMTLGILGGPVGVVIGGLAGALGGWWAGRGVAEAIDNDDDQSLREHYESSADRLADRPYEDLRPAYVMGHLAARNPDYAGRSFDEVERDLAGAWGSDVAERHGAWPSVRSYARAAFDRARARERTR